MSAGKTLERLLATRRAFIRSGATAALGWLSLLHSPNALAGRDKDKKSERKKSKDKKRKKDKTGDKDKVATPYTGRTEVIAAPELRAELLGSYEGDTQIGLGRVSDLVKSRPPELLGGIGDVGLVSRPRHETVRAALSALMSSSGLFTDTGSAPTTMNVFILRYGVVKYPKRVRAEVVLQFVFRAEGQAATRGVLACGNAEAGPILKSKQALGLVEPVFHAAFEDAFSKLVQSATFRDVAGPGWSPGSGIPERVGITRAGDEGYRPNPWAVETMPALRREVQAPTELILEDLAVMDRTYIDNKGGDPRRAATRLPALVLENLATFYPGAFRIARSKGASKGRPRGLILTGTVRRYDAGGSRHKLMVDIYLKDGKTDLNRFSIQTRWLRRPEPVVGSPSPRSATWWAYDGDRDINQMEERLASDLAYLLVMSRPQPYAYPDNPEVRFDGRERPPGLIESA